MSTIKRKKKICKSCGKEAYIVSKGDCGYCAGKRYAKTTARNQRKNYEPTGEREIHLKLWEIREHICVSCGDYLGEEPLPVFFSHTIPKKYRPDLRLVEENYEFECMGCHHVWDNGTMKQKMLSKAFNKRLDYIKKMDLPMWHGWQHKISKANS